VAAWAFRRAGARRAAADGLGVATPFLAPVLVIAGAVDLDAAFPRSTARSYDPRVSVDQNVVGKYGRVTGKVASGTVGEVMLAIRGGVEAFYAYPVDGGEEIEIGAQVVVLEYEPPRTVVVTRLT